jgi:cobalt-zinc-cadmium efflux system membrane fusion protein
MRDEIMNATRATFLTTVMLIGAGALITLFVRPSESAVDPNSTADTTAIPCAKHEAPQCPFCHPALIEKLGYCRGHQVPEALCTRCNAAIIPAFKAQNDWCAEHELPASQCVACNPAVKDRWASMASKTTAKPGRDPNRLWCTAHGVYEDECLICHPDLKHKRAAGDGHLDLWCKEHNVAERECGICQPQLATALTAGKGLKVRLPSSRSATKAGIRTALPRAAEITGGFQVFCEAHFNQNRLARITPLVSGVIHKVHVDVGQSVSEGDLLIEIASVEIAAAKRDYLLAIVDERLKKLAHDRQKRLAAKEISAVQNLQQAEAEYEMAQIATLAAHQKLLNFGFTPDEADEVAETKSSSSIVHIHSPFSGTLVERSAVVGEAVKPGTPLFTLADLSTMWLTLSIPESKVGMARLRMPIRATFSAIPGREATGKITWINASVSEPSRMVEARAVVDNPGGALRNNMFGEAQIILEPGRSTLTVPTSAVQQFEQRPFVFVKLDEDMFELRRVVLGNKHLNRVQVLGGVSGDEAIAVGGSFTLISEFLKSRLGAGCVDD